ncbi:MAG TPA: hypothetical protein VG015_01495 [Candidatus Dormibacteraeota bacterium]|nr:hypothetical protein [Candidatus Dormibacteraeota bacterium]
MIVATDPERDPIAEEGNRLLDENPDLLRRLQEFERDYPLGKVNLVEHEEVRRRLKVMGAPLED